MMKERKGIKIILFVLLLFLLFNTLWFIHHKIIYGKYERITKDSSVPGVYISPKDELTFSVSKIKYLSFGGNLGISDPQKGMYLIIWPHLFKDYEYGFMIMGDNGSYNFYINIDGALEGDASLSEEDIKIFDMNSDELSFLIEEYKLWQEASEKNDKTFFLY